jgi:hypothetical protein
MSAVGGFGFGRHFAFILVIFILLVIKMRIRMSAVVGFGSRVIRSANQFWLAFFCRMS